MDQVLPWPTLLWMRQPQAHLGQVATWQGETWDIDSVRPGFQHAWGCVPLLWTQEQGRSPRSPDPGRSVPKRRRPTPARLPWECGCSSVGRACEELRLLPPHLPPPRVASSLCTSTIPLPPSHYCLLAPPAPIPFPLTCVWAANWSSLAITTSLVWFFLPLLNLLAPCQSAWL